MREKRWRKRRRKEEDKHGEEKEGEEEDEEEEEVVSLSPSLACYLLQSLSFSRMLILCLSRSKLFLNMESLTILKAGVFAEVVKLT